MTIVETAVTPGCYSPALPEGVPQATSATGLVVEHFAGMMMVEVPWLAKVTYRMKLRVMSSFHSKVGNQLLTVIRGISSCGESTPGRAPLAWPTKVLGKSTSAEA